MSFLHWNESADEDAPSTPPKVCLRGFPSHFRLISLCEASCSSLLGTARCPPPTPQSSFSKVPSRPKTALRGGLVRATADLDDQPSNSPTPQERLGGKARAPHNPVFQRLSSEENPIVGNYHGEDDERLACENNGLRANTADLEQPQGNSFKHKLRAHHFDIALHETPMKQQELQRAKQMNAASRLRIMQDPDNMATPANRRTRRRAVENDAQKREKELQAELPQRACRRANVPPPCPENDLFAVASGQTPLKVGIKRVDHFQKQTHVHNVLRMIAENGSGAAGLAAEFTDDDDLDSDIEQQVISGRKSVRDANHYQLSSDGVERLMDNIRLVDAADQAGDDYRKDEVLVIPARRKHLEAARKQMQGSMRDVIAAGENPDDSEGEEEAAANKLKAPERRQRSLVQGRHQHHLWAPEDEDDE